MKTFSKDILYQKQDNKFYVIEDGIIKTDNVGGMTAEHVSATEYLVVTQHDGYLSCSVAEWGANYWYTNNTIDFSKYTKLCVDYEIPTALGSNANFILLNRHGTGSEADLHTFATSRSQFSRKIEEYTLPSPIPSTMDKLYFIFINTVSDINIYNMWLE